MRVVGVDIGSRAFHLVLLEGTSKKWKVVGVASESVPKPGEGEDPQAALAAAVENAFRRLKAPRDPVVALVPAGECVFRTIALPFKGEEQIRKVLKFESEGHLHQWNIDDVVVDYVSLAETKGQTTVLVVAAPKAVIRRVLQTSEACGFDPQTLDLDATALFNAAVHSGAAGTTGSRLLLHVGASSTLLLVVEEGALRDVRSIRAGLEPLPTAAAQKAAEEGDAGGTDSGSEGSPDPAGIPPGAERDPVPGRREELVARLVREVTRSMAGLALKSPVETIYLSGGGSTLPEVQSGLAAGLERPVEVWNVLEQVEGEIPENDARTAGPLVPAALGAALKAIGLDATRIDLRQEEVRFTRTFDRVKVPLLCALFLVLTALLLQNIYSLRRTDTLRQSHEVLAQAGLDYAKNLAGLRAKLPPEVRELDRLKILKGQVEQKLRDLNDRLGRGVDQPMSAFEASRLLLDRIAEGKDDLGRISLDHLKFATTGKPVREGIEQHVAASFDALFYGEGTEAAQHYERLMSAIESAPWARKLDRPGHEAHPEGRLAKGVKFEVVVPAEPSPEKSP